VGDSCGMRRANRAINLPHDPTPRPQAANGASPPFLTRLRNCGDLLGRCATSLNSESILQCRENGQVLRSSGGLLADNDPVKRQQQNRHACHDSRHGTPDLV